jgi:hypothetical protein
MGHVLGLGHANFDGNLMAEKVNDGTENVSECEIKAVLKAKLLEVNSRQYCTSYA